MAIKTHKHTACSQPKMPTIQLLIMPKRSGGLLFAKQIKRNTIKSSLNQACKPIQESIYGFISVYSVR